jgi:hypothetical protein
MTRKTGIVVSGVLLSLLLACQPASLPGVPPSGPGQPAVVSLGAVPGATLNVNIQGLSRLRTKALPKSASDVHMYEITLHKASDGSQVGAQPLRIAGSSTTGQFIGVPADTYYVKVDAFSDGTPGSPGVPGTVSLLRLDPVTHLPIPAVQSENTVQVANGIANYNNETLLNPAPTSLVVNIPLQDGTQGTAGSLITVQNRTVALAGADKSGLALLNLATGRATPNAAYPSITYQLNNVQTGAASGDTHELWAYAVKSADSTASVPRPYAMGTNPAGTIINSFTIPHTGQTLSTGSGGVAAAVAIATDTPLVTDGSNNVYYIDGSNNVHQRASTGNYANDAVVLTGDTGVLKGWAVALNSAGFYSTGNNIMRAGGALASNGTLAVTANNVGIMAIDEINNLYYLETLPANTIKRCVYNGSAYMDPVTVMVTGFAPKMMATDSYGNVFYSNGTDVYKAVLDTDERTYLPGAVKVVSAAGITSMAVDRVGNVYFTDATHAVKMVGAGETNVTIFTLAGPGAGLSADSITGTATTLNLNTPNNVAMTPTGRLIFTSQGTTLAGDGITPLRFFRYI